MKLTGVDVVRSQFGRDRQRLTGTIVYATPGLAPEQIWFDAPRDCADALSRTGNPWLACLLPLAVTLREPLELCAPVDPVLREGAEAVMQVWRGWYPTEYQPITISVDLLTVADVPQGERNGAFFSGGIDSFYTLLRHEADGDAFDRIRIDDLLTVWGLDIPLAEPAAFDRLIGRMNAVADSVGKQVIPLATNLRESGWRAANWGRISQGPGLASIGLSLESRFRRILVPSSISYRSGAPWGTHPFVDPLLSTSITDVRDDGALLRRLDKAERIVGSPLAMGNLRVCWMGKSDTNCGRCEKCLRTLTAFELFGALDRCTTFPPGTWSLKAITSMRLRHDMDRRHMVRLRERVAERGRRDIARALSQAIRRYDARKFARKLLRVVRRRS